MLFEQELKNKVVFSLFITTTEMKLFIVKVQFTFSHGFNEEMDYHGWNS